MASPSLEFRRHQQQRKRLRPAGRPLYRFSRLLGGERAKSGIDELIRLARQAPGLASDLVGDIEAFGEAVDPGGALVGKSFWRRRPPKCLTEQGLCADNAPYVRRK